MRIMFLSRFSRSPVRAPERRRCPGGAPAGPSGLRRNDLDLAGHRRILAGGRGGVSGGPLLGMSTCSVCTLRLRARSPVASSSARARLAKPSMSPACPTPVKQRRLADARFLRSTSIALSSLRAAASTLQGERSRTGWPAYGVHVNSAVSFSVLPAIAHVSVRVALAAPNSACRPAGRARTSPVGTLCPPGRR